MKELTGFDLGYIAALFEMHGGLCLEKTLRRGNQPCFRLRIQVTSPNVEALRRARNICGCGHIWTRARCTAAGQPFYIFCIYRQKDMLAFLRLMIPHLSRMKHIIPIGIEYLKSRVCRPRPNAPYTDHEIALVRLLQEKCNAA